MRCGSKVNVAYACTTRQVTYRKASYRFPLVFSFDLFSLLRFVILRRSCLYILSPGILFHRFYERSLSFCIRFRSVLTSLLPQCTLSLALTLLLPVFLRSNRSRSFSLLPLRSTSSVSFHLTLDYVALSPYCFDSCFPLLFAVTSSPRSSPFTYLSLVPLYQCSPFLLFPRFCARPLRSSSLCPFLFFLCIWPSPASYPPPSPFPRVFSA